MVVGFSSEIVRELGREAELGVWLGVEVFFVNEKVI